MSTIKTKVDIFQDSLFQQLAKENIQSIEEANEFLKKMVMKKNLTGVGEFLGLSPAQMNVILYNEFEFGEFVKLDFESKDAARNISVIQQAHFICDRLLVTEEIKLTQTGNLPPRMVKDFWEQFCKNDISFEPNNQNDLYEIIFIFELLKLAGITKTVHKKLSLTKVGQKLISSKDDNGLYLKLFLAGFNKWNWSYGDFFTEFHMLWLARTFNLLLLSEKANKTISVKGLLTFFTQAFPRSLDFKVHDFYPTTQFKELEFCFKIRFLKRICLPFGLIECDPQLFRHASSEDLKIKTSDFFNANFKFDKGFSLFHE